MNQANTINELVLKLKARQEIDLAYIFGSSVSEPVATPKDIDIALYVKENLKPETVLDIQLELAELAEHFFGRSADIIILNKASPFLRYQVLKKGKLLFTRTQEIDSSFRFKTMTDYFDSLVLQNYFYSRMAKGERHG